jgi:hypothetical protein
MRKFTLAALLLIFSLKSSATHLTGGELRYEFNGTNYTIYFYLYSQCVNIPGPITVSGMYGAGSLTSSLTLHMQHVDTLYDMYCSATSANCSSGPYFWIVTTYSDTVSLPPASNWKFSFSLTSVYASIMNINPASGSEIYATAFLNNSTAVNSSAVLANHPPFNVTNNATTTVELGAVDPDGDSLAEQMVQPMSDTATYFSYYAGYSVSAPFGSGSSTTFSSDFSKLYITAGSSTGYYGLEMKTSEYRAGTLVGYSTRFWGAYSTGTVLPKAPYLYIADQHPAIVGQDDSLSVQFLDSTSTDSVFIDFQTTNGWSYTPTSSSSTGYASGKIKWTTPSAVDPATYPYFYIYVRAYDHSCPYTGESWYAFAIPVAYPNDSVWPGDANGDKTVNIYDPLAVAVAYGKTGPSRTGASTSWLAQYCAAWSTSFVSGINMNKADCNGDGTVNSTDLGAVTTNYGSTHPKGSWNNGARTTGVPELYFDLTGINLVPGSAVTVPIKLGSSSLPVSKLYGVAGSVVISGITPTVDPTYSTPATTWMGTSSNTLSFNKQVNSNKLDFAYAKTDHVNANGQGVIANISFTVPSSAALGTQVVLSFAGVKFIDSAGKPLTSFNVLSDTSAVTTAVPNVNTALVSAMILPNPSTNYANIKLNLDKDAQLQMQITDIVGKTVWQQSGDYKAGNQTIAAPASALPAGMYLLHISGEGWQYPVIKWIKE